MDETRIYLHNDEGVFPSNVQMANVKLHRQKLLEGAALTAQIEKLSGQAASGTTPDIEPLRKLFQLA